MRACDLTESNLRTATTFSTSVIPIIHRPLPVFKQLALALVCAALSMATTAPAQSSRPGWGSTPYHDAQGTGVTFRVWAPNATSVFVPGTFTSPTWLTTATPLAKELPGGSALVLREIFLRGEIARGEVSRIIATSPRTAQKATGELLAQQLVTSGSPKGPLRLGFPADAAGHYFPNLYPAGTD